MTEKNGQRESKLPYNRISEIDRIIREGCYPNSTYLKDKLEVSRATISRDIEYLRDTLGAPLAYDKQKQGYYYTQDNFFVQNVMLSEGELFTVSTMIPLLEQYKNTPLESSFRNIMEKITGMLPDEVCVDSGFVDGELKFISDPLPKISEDVFKAMFEACKLHTTSEFFYRSINRQDYKLHSVNPYKILCQKGNWYIIGYSNDVGDIRVYALSRMKDPLLTGKKFKIPEDFKLEDYIDSLGVWNSREEVQSIELLFDKSVSTFILERNWHEDQEMSQNEDGSVLLKFKAKQLKQILYWVMSLGSSVKVLNPPLLKEMVKEEARSILNKYQEES